MWKWISQAAKDTWTFLDGKKTTIGTACLIAANYIPRDKTAYYILNIAGELLGGVGIAHKLNKADKLPEGIRKSQLFIKSIKEKKQ